MATSTRIRDRLAESTGLSASWLDQVVRFLREKGFVETAGRGGGKNAVHHGLRSLGAIWMGLAAPRAVEAPEAYEALRGMVLRGQHPPSRVSAALPTFEDQIEDWIKGAGTARLNGGEWDPPSLAVLQSLQANICIDPPSAVITVEFEDGITTTIVYTGEDSAAPGVRRITTISGDVLLAFGELWADTEIQRTAQRQLAALRNSSARMDAENDDANRLCQEATAPSHQDQSPAKGSESLNTSDTTGGLVRGEASSHDGTDHDSKPEPDLFTHAGSARCLTLT